MGLITLSILGPVQFSLHMLLFALANNLTSLCLSYTIVELKCPKKPSSCGFGQFYCSIGNLLSQILLLFSRPDAERSH